MEEIVRQTIPDGLTRRETEIFTLLLTDADKNMIVDTLKISSGTYNFHVTNLYRKLDIQSRPELFAKYAGVLDRHIKAEGSEKKAVIKNVR